MQESKGLIENSYGIRIMGIRPYRAGYILIQMLAKVHKAC